jgi:multisubunit Na+/H+ antiporter MnhG subunit
MELLAWTISIIASLSLMISALAFLKARDLYSMTHVIMISNCYILPLLLIGLGVEKFSLISSAKILALILLNIIITNLLCYTILRKAVSDKIRPEAEVKI